MLPLLLDTESFLSLVRLQNQESGGGKWEWHHSSVTLSDSLAKLVLPVITTIYSAGLEVLVPKGGMFPLEDTELEVKTVVELLWVPYTLKSRSREWNYAVGWYD